MWRDPTKRITEEVRGLLEMTLEGTGELQQQSSPLITTHINMHGFALESSYTTWPYLLAAFSPFSFSESHFTLFGAASCLQVQINKFFSCQFLLPYTYVIIWILPKYSLNILIYTTLPKVCGHALVDYAISATPVADRCVRSSTQPCNFHRQTFAVEWSVLKSSVTFNMAQS